MKVEDLIGKPFKRGGRGPDSYDCAGLVVEVLRRRNISLSIPDTPAIEHLQALSMARILRARWVDVEQPFPGCVVFFRPDHVGVMLDRWRFIHADQACGVCIEPLNHPMWKSKFAGFYEYAGAGL
jgi:cell wall-associated NlpC family hydrolase